MTRRSPLALILLATTLAGAQTTKPAVKHSGSTTGSASEPWKKIPVPPLHDFKPAQPTKITLANGLTIFLQPDHELPFISGSILIRGGSRDEPADKVGLVSLYGQTWRTSGTKTEPGDQLDEKLALKAASVETGGGSASTSLGWSSFKQDFDPTFASAMDVLLHPDFQAAKLQLAQRRTAAGIARRNDDADAIAGRQAAILVYGKTSPYARQVEYATVGNVTIADLQAWHDRTVVPNDMIVSVYGDFDPATVEAELRTAFAPLAQGAAMPVHDEAFTDPKPGVYYVDKTDVNQSQVYIVGLGTKRNNPDYYALSVMNEVFSGGFGSRIFQNVRTKLGLAYQVYGNYGSSYDHPGMFTVVAATKSASTIPATRAMLAEVARLKSDPPTPAELSSAKDQVLNSFIFNYDTPEKVLSEQVSLAFYGYPADFLEKYKAGIEQVTAADVTRVANKYVQPNKLAILVVGNGADFGGPLSTLGPVQNLDIAIPPPPTAPTQSAK